MHTTPKDFLCKLLAVRHIMQLYGGSKLSGVNVWWVSNVRWGRFESGCSLSG